MKRPTARRVCVLAGAGEDSSMLIADRLGRGWEVHPLYVRCGFVWEAAELHWLRRLLGALAGPRLRPLVVAEAPMAPILAGHWSLSGRGVPAAGSAWDSVRLPGRNLVLLSQAALYCAQAGLARVELAVLEGNPFPDAKPAFLRAMSRAAAAALGRPIRFEAPYARLSKARVRGLVPGFPAQLTFSCLRPRGLRPCGGCSKCEERAAISAPDSARRGSP